MTTSLGAGRAARPDEIGPFVAWIESEGLALPRPLPPASPIGVDHLVEPDVLVELEATAVS